MDRARQAIPASDERANTATAAAGLALACVGALAMLPFAMRTGDAWKIASAIVFCATLVLLHLASTLYHATAEPVAKSRRKVLDHCAIYLLIAGTYTPFTLVALHGRLGWTLFATIWTLAACGVVFKLFSTGRLRVLSTVIYVAMGWLVVFAIRPVSHALDAWTLGWLLAGGIAYTLGTVFYHRPGMRHAHAIWHGFVIAGGACHYVAVLAQLSPAP